MAETLNILAPTRYPWRFNSPRQSRHNISIRNFVPFNKLSPAIEGLTVFNPWPPKRFDLIHAFNRIPMGGTPFIIGFESHLPRAFGLEDSWFFAGMTKMLVSPRCRGIIAISDFARRQFLAQHAGTPWEGALADKLSMRYPNIPIPGADAFVAGETLRLVFVGGHFARKGGCMAVRLAELAGKRGLKLHIDIISGLDVGTASWIGPTRESYYERDFKLLESLPNVTHHGSLPNATVLELIGKAHFLLLPTFGDTFGFSVIEAMAAHTPALVTHQAALPEFVEDGKNGIVLPLDNNGIGEWVYAGRADRDSPAYEAMFDEQTDKLAEAAYAKLETLMRSPLAYAAMRTSARATAEKLFSAADANRFWDDYYCRAAR